MGDRLRLYGLYKQATLGDAPAPKLTWTHIIDNQKLRAWEALRGMGETEAKERYVQALDEIDMEWRTNDIAGDGATDVTTLDRSRLIARVLALEGQLSRLARGEDRGWLYRFSGHGGALLFGRASSRWERRFFVLTPKAKGVPARLLYYRSESDHSKPRRAIPLSNVLVVDEGEKRLALPSSTFYVFSLYLVGTLASERGPGSGALIRLSTASRTEALRWMANLDEAGGQRGVDGVQWSTSTARDCQNAEGEARGARPRFDPRLFTASRPMHRQSQPSLLSAAGRTGSEVELSGLINLALIVLFSTHAHLLLENMLLYGFFPLSSDTANLRPRALVSSALAFLLCFMPQPAHLIFAWVIERAAIRRQPPSRYLSGGLADALHSLNATLAIAVPCALVTVGACSSSAGGLVLLSSATILFMKLASYAHVHRDLRLASLESDGVNDDEAALAKFVADVRDTEGHAHYPHNVTLRALGYFALAPTLCYQEAFPRTPTIRPGYLASLCGRLLALCAFITFACFQLILPLLRNTVAPVCAADVPTLFEKLLKLALPVTYVWLAAFYAFFHVYLNLIAELLRFGDRLFYKAWWNAVTFEQYWRLWNMPVHNWIARHVFFPCLRREISKPSCGLIAFTLSAVFHELIIALPLRSLHMPLAFLAMMAQVPLVSATAWINRLAAGSPFEQLGNYLFWVSFCFFGQPLAVLLYYNMLIRAERPEVCIEIETRGTLWS